jgi:hypothetical protein
VVAIGIVQSVRLRAGGRCEYCRQPEVPIGFRHCIDHVIARQHRGTDDATNLARCCIRCNLAKGPNIASLDPTTGALTRLYHPRLDRWSDPFAFDGPRLLGTTAIGRTTAMLLDVNSDLRVRSRRMLLAAGRRLGPG